MRPFRQVLIRRLPVRHMSGSTMWLQKSVGTTSNTENLNEESVFDTETGRPLIPADLKKASEPQRLQLGASMPFKVASNPEMNRLRILPQEATFYGGNPKHDANMDRLNSLLRKYINLPTVSGEAKQQQNQSGHQTRKFITYEEYVKRLNSGTRLRPLHHQELVQTLNRLRSIDPQLMPNEVVEVLDEYTKWQSVDTSVEKKEETLDEYGRSVTEGRRKTSKAKVYMTRGDGIIMINGKSILEYFPKTLDRTRLSYPFAVVNQLGNFNVFAEVVGGGTSGQCEAIMYGIAKGLVLHNPLFKSRLHGAGLMTRDTRIVERKKPGHRKARKMPQWVKR